jgi:hypothetical protein
MESAAMDMAAMDMAAMDMAAMDMAAMDLAGMDMAAKVPLLPTAAPSAAGSAARAGTIHAIIPHTNSNRTGFVI